MLEKISLNKWGENIRRRKPSKNRITNINGLDQFEKKEMIELCQMPQKELRKNLAEGSTDMLQSSRSPE